jgi:hypothetical protein
MCWLSFVMDLINFGIIIAEVNNPKETVVLKFIEFIFALAFPILWAIALYLHYK